MISRPLGVWTIAGLVAYSAVLGTGFLGVRSCAAPGASYTPGSAVVGRDGTLRIVGLIDDHLAILVHDALALSTVHVTHVTLDSYGGQTHAMWEIAGTLRTTQAILDVPAGATCQSACVGLLASSPRRIVIAPDATLMFHAERSRFGLANRGPCGWLNTVVVWASRTLAPVGTWIARLQGRDTTPMMQLWAQQLSPNLPKVFALCPTNPLETDRGILFTGSEVNSLTEGTVRPEDLISRCPT